MSKIGTFVLEQLEKGLELIDGEWVDPTDTEEWNKAFIQWEYEKIK